MERFTRERLVTFFIKQVVGNLKGEADVAGIATQRCAPFGRHPAHDCTRLDAEGYKRAGLHLLQPRHTIQVERLCFGGNIHHLPACHARWPARPRKPLGQLNAYEGIGIYGFVNHQFKRQGMKRIPGQHGNGFVKCFVHRRLAASHVVIVHAG